VSAARPLSRARRAALDAGVFAAAALLAFAGGSARAAEGDSALQATVRLDPAVAAIDEYVTLSIVVESSGFGGIQVTPTFELENLEAVAGPFQSRSQRWVNGKTSSSVQLTWRLRAKKVGEASVRAIRLAAEGHTLELADRKIEIRERAPGGASPIPPSRRADPFEDFFTRAFPDARSQRRAPAKAPKIRLEAEVVPADPFVGQQATYTLWLYTQSDISAFQPTKVPDFRGFWVREIPQPEQLTPEWVVIDGERFGRVPMLRRAIFPLQEGRHTLEPTEVDVVARIAEIGPFGSPFGRNESLHLKTGSPTLTARALPPPPAGAAGVSPPVGEITLSARLDRSALEVGQAATLTVRCTGRGNLQSLAPLELHLPDGLTGFAPRQESSDRLTDGLLVSSTEWSYVIVPERPGQFEIPELTIPYFDPAKREYRFASAPASRLSVTGEPVVTVGDGPETTEGEEAETSAEPSPASAGALARIPRAVWFGLGGIAVLILGAAALHALRRSMGAARSTSARILQGAIAQAAREPTPRQAAAALEEAWRQHLAERWRIPPGAPVSTWTERLVAERADAGAARALAELAHELHYLRYAPELSAADRLLADALDSSRRLARALR
jgi:hypothetical protein